MDLLESLDVEAQVDILALVKAKGFRPPTRSQSGRIASFDIHASFRYVWAFRRNYDRYVGFPRRCDER